MPIDMNGISRCKGADGINFGGEQASVGVGVVVTVHAPMTMTSTATETENETDTTGQCWWIRNYTSGAMSCKYCDVELEKGKEGSMTPGSTPGPSPKRGGWL